MSRDSMCSNLSLRRQESTRCLYIGNSVIFCLMSPKTGLNNELLYACLASTFGVAWLNSCKPMLGTTTGLVAWVGDRLAARLVARLWLVGWLDARIAARLWLVAWCWLDARLWLVGRLVAWLDARLVGRLVARLVGRLDLLCRTNLGGGFGVGIVVSTFGIERFCRLLGAALAAALDSAKARRYASIYSFRVARRCAARSDMACTKHKPNAFLCSTRFK